MKKTKKVLVSIVVATKNRCALLEKTINGLIETHYPAKEIFVTNDGSTDQTKKLLDDFQKKYSCIKVKHLEKSGGPAKARNWGIQQAKGKYIVIMDDDCVASKNWLNELLEPFSNDLKVGISSSFGLGGGTSTAYRADLLKKIGGFDPEFPRNFREDTDTVFKIQDLGYAIVYTNKAKFDHYHPFPTTFQKKLEYIWKRIVVHQDDALLFKKHPKRGTKFFNVHFGFLRSPMDDFKTATGLWWPGNKMNISSPQGIVFIQNKSFLHTLVIVLLGIGYVIAVKMARLYGSIKYGTLLV